jgi:hypothetical protein
MEKDRRDRAFEAVGAENLSAFIEELGPRCQSLYYETPFGSWLHYAAQEGKFTVVEWLLGQGMPIDLPENSLGGTPLRSAVLEGGIEMVAFLLSKGAQLSVDSAKANPLFTAIVGDKPAIVELLLANGIDCHKTYCNRAGVLTNALSFAERFGRTDISKMLRAVGCELPRQAESPHGAAPTPREQLIGLVSSRLGPVEPLSIQELVPVTDDVRISIHIIRPTDLHPYLTLFTSGMSDRPMTPPDENQIRYRLAELIMHLPPDWKLSPKTAKQSEFYWPVQWLRQVAYYPHLANTWLGGQFTVITNDEPPQPLGPLVPQTALLIVADYDDWSPAKLASDKVVHFYTVMPIFTEEVLFEKKFGVERLLNRLARKGIKLVADPKRNNVCE